MTEDQKNEHSEDIEQKETGQETSEPSGVESNNIEALEKSLKQANDKYIRLYADFENYKKIAARNKEELLKYANEDLMADILTVIDHLELALEHAKDSSAASQLAEGVELTLKELRSALEKHGLTTIDALNKPFDPSVHHAMSQIESDDKDENTVVKEFRKGYMLRDRVLRAAMVGVSVKPPESGNAEAGTAENEPVSTDEKQ